MDKVSSDNYSQFWGQIQDARLATGRACLFALLLRCLWSRVRLCLAAATCDTRTASGKGHLVPNARVRLLQLESTGKCELLLAEC